MDRRVALVTGGSRGIGRQIAIRMAQDGWAVAVSYNSASTDAEDVVRTITSAGGEAMSLQGDVRDADTAQAWVDAVEGRWGGLTALVNNAGVARDRMLENMTADDWSTVLETDLSGPFYCTRAAAPLLMLSTDPAVVNVASIVGLNGNAGQANYAAAKGGLIALTKSLAREFGPRGITVNAVAGGLIMTDMTVSLPPEILDANIASTPLGRPGLPEDIAGVVAFLCGPEARFLTGTVIPVDGGLSL